MKNCKSLIGLVIVVALVVGMAFLFLQVTGAQQDNTKKANFPSTAAVKTGTPSLVATSPTPPSQPEKPEAPTHREAAPKLAASALGAYPMSITAAAKPEKVEGYRPPQRSYEGVPVLEGGEDCATAVAISLPHTSTGNTCDNVDDYEENGVFDCPYTSTSPDVVYSYTPSADQCIDIDLYGSSYDTKVWVYEDICETAYLYACNDDYYPDYVSAIFGLPIYSGHTYYIVVDGYGGDCGDYLLNVSECVECDVVCPPGGVDEGEGDCYDNYEDTYNVGCNGDPDFIFQPIACGDTICGTSGVYDYYGSTYRDMDWFRLELAGPAILTWTGVAEFPMALWIFDAGSEDCVDMVQLAFNNTYVLCDTLSISADVPAGVYWFIIAPADWGDYACGVEYVAWLDCEVATTGACCYDFDPYTCTIETPEDCAALPDHTFKGLGTDCDPNPCLPAPDNDECENAIQIYPPDCPSVQTVFGTTVGATIDCPGVLNWEAVWYKFELTYDCNNVLIDYCPTNRPDVYTRGVVLYDECPADCPNYILYTGLSWVTCGSGYTDLTVWWNALPPGTYWLPVYVEDASGNQLDFGFDICVEECFAEPGDNCANPIVVDLNKGPGDTLYLDQNQTTCGRVDDYYGTTCLGYYDGGEDIIYQVNVSAAVDVDIRMDPKGTTWTGLAIDVACPPGATCMAYSTGSSGTRVLTGVHLDPGTYYIMVDTWPSPDCIPDFDLVITEAAGPQLNDDCANATPISDVIELPFSTTTATFDGPGTCQTAPNIWYCYTATCDGMAHIALCGSGYDTKLGVYEGCECDPVGTMLGCNDDGCGGTLQSDLTIPVVAGNEYLIEVGGYSSNTGDGVLTCTCYVAGEPPENDNCEGAPIISTFPTTMYGTTIDATVDCPGVLDWNAVWYRFDLPYACNNVFVDFCPSDLYIGQVGIVVYGECPPDCPAYILASGYQWVTCPSGYDDPQIWWNNLPGPASYWFPVAVWDQYGSPFTDFGFEVSVEECVPCTLVCPPGGIPEGEPDCYDSYVDNYNGGCNSSPYIWQSISCGDTICGTSGVYADNYYRDTDWFRVEVGDGDLTWTCVAEFPVLLFIMDAGSENCSDYTTLTYNYTYDLCDTLSISYYVTAGVYWVWVGPVDWGNYPCGDQSEYVAWINCTPYGPQMAVSPTSMYPVLNPTGPCSSETENLTISSVGGEDLTYSITENPPVDWMELSSYGGTIPPGDEDVIDVSFDAGGMAPGDYYCDLEIDHNDPSLPDPYVVTVHLEVELAPEIQVAPRLWAPVVSGCMMDYGFRINNLGEGDLNFNIAVSPNPDPLSGGKSSVREAFEALQKAGKANPALTPKEAYKSIGAKRSTVEYHSTGAAEGLLLSAGGGKQASILLVDDDGGLPGGTYYDVEDIFMDALDANGFVYDYYVVDWTDPLSPGPDLATMQNYSCVIWFTGETWGYYGHDTFTPTDETNMAAYLSGGGNLFLSAQDYLYDMYPSAGSFSSGQFPYDYLGLQSVVQDILNDPYTAVGLAGSVAEGMQFETLRFTDNPDVPLWTDDLTGRAGVVDVFDAYGYISAVQNDGGTFKTVFTTTAFPGLVDASPSTRAELMASILTWFGCVGPACPFTVDPANGTVPAESFFDVTLSFDGTLFTECVDETLTCYLRISSNDCDEPLVKVDVHALSARGDVNGDCQINIADIVFLVNYVFGIGPAPDPLCIADVTRDGNVNSDDALYLASWLFEYGPPPEIITAPKGDKETMEPKTITPIKQTPIRQK